MKKILFTLILILLFTNYVNAECLDNDLLKYIREVELKYKVIDSSTKSDYLYYLYVDPKRDDIELKSTNSLYSGVTSSIELEGNIVIPSYIHYDTKEYSVEVYVKKDASSCAGELLTTLSYTVPPYNYYSKTDFCNSHSDEEICQVMSESYNLTNEEFIEAAKEIEKKIVEEKKPWWYKLIFDYLIWILPPALIIGLVFYAKINKVKKAKNDA